MNPNSAEEADATEEKSVFGVEEGLRWFSDFFFWPFLWFFAKLRLPPDLATGLGVVCALASGYFLATERVWLAAVLFTSSGILDIVDGYLAKKFGKVTVFGSFLDSTADRISEGAIYVGLMVYFMRQGSGLYVGLSLAMLLASYFISYMRARAAGLGVEASVGLMARPMRFIALAAGLFFNGLSPWVLRGAMWLISIFLTETLFRRFIYIWKELERKEEPE